MKSYKTVCTDSKCWFSSRQGDHLCPEHRRSVSSTTFRAPEVTEAMTSHAKALEEDISDRIYNIEPLVAPHSLWIDGKQVIPEEED